MAATDQTRLLLVEDVPQVAQYIRGLLNSQSAIKLLDVISEGAKVPGQVQQLRPDVILVDALLQGRVKGLQLVEQLRNGKAGAPVIVLTVPQNPVSVDHEKGIYGVLAMPFSGYDLVTRINQVRSDYQSTSATGSSRVVSVFAPKGGVGKTTIAFNLACALGQQQHKTVLIDGSLQFGDLRALLKVPADAPSVLDLPTDRIVESDLSDVLWRDPSGIDILLAPPRVEMAEMVTARDIDNRSDWPAGINPDDLARALGRVPEHSIVSDGKLVVQSNNEGVPFVLANPGAPISQDVVRIASEVMAVARTPVGARR